MKGKLSIKKERTPSNWGQAIADAKERLSRNKAQASKIRVAIGIFQDKLVRNEPWPVQSPDHTSDTATQC